MARFTEHQGDPAWLKSQREAQKRAVTHRVHRAMPYPTQTPTVTPTAASNAQFRTGAQTSNSGTAFVLGLIAGAYLRGRRG